MHCSVDFGQKGWVQCFFWLFLQKQSPGNTCFTSAEFLAIKKNLRRTIKKKTKND
jgi:hypothetical protein